MPLASWNSSIAAYGLKFTRMGTVPAGLWCVSLLVSGHTKLLQHWPSLTHCQCWMKWSQANITRSITLYWQSRDTMILDRRRVDRENLDLCFSRIPVSPSQLSGVHNLQTNNREKSFLHKRVTISGEWKFTCAHCLLSSWVVFETWQLLSI